MIYTVSLYISLAIFAIGSIFKISRWFRFEMAPGTETIGTATRITSAARGVFSTLFSKKMPVLVKVFFVDHFFQGWLLKKGFLRWFSHICIFGGFVFLLIMHGLESIVTTAFFPEYASTLNPYMFLRDLSAAIVFLGIALALYRRCIAQKPRPKTTGTDWMALGALALIMVSGVLLEGTKIPSYGIFQEMVEEYGGLDTQEETIELKALEAYWVTYYGVVSPNTDGSPDRELLAQGEELHAMSCADCHSRPYWAFMGYGVAKAVQPVAIALDRAEIQVLLWYIHFLSCFIGLAILPFSKFFHIIATPVYLFVNAAMEEEKTNPANIATKRAMELDACTHCGECTTRCSVAVTYHKIPNPNILPSEKLAAMKKLYSGGKISPHRLSLIQEGNHICTDCHRCTDVCPVGINLSEQWDRLGRYLSREGYPRLEVWARETLAGISADKGSGEQDIVLGPPEVVIANNGGHGLESKTFSACFGCQTCTNVCPVVASFKNPKEQVDLLPHQIMHSLALGQTTLTLGCRMLWDCVTCYQCQEECPQGVRVTEVLYQLKNLAVRHAKGQNDKEG